MASTSSGSSATTGPFVHVVHDASSARAGIDISIDTTPETAARTTARPRVDRLVAAHGDDDPSRGRVSGGSDGEAGQRIPNTAAEAVNRLWPFTSISPVVINVPAMVGAQASRVNA